MSFALGTSRNPAIIVARTPVSRPPFKTIGQIRAAEAAARSARRQASYASNRLVAVPRGVPMYAVGRSQLARGEVKFFDVNVTAPANGTFGLFVPSAPPTGAEPVANFAGITELNCVSQGATSYNRIGTKILVKSIDFRAVFSLAGTGPTRSTFRYMIVYDRQPNGAFPAFSDILSANISTAPGMFTGVNMANRSRFLVLRDRVQTLDEDAGNGGSLNVKEFIKTKLETQFRTNAGNIGDITTGAIYLIAFAITASAVSYITMTSATSRIRYFD